MTFETHMHAPFSRRTAAARLLSASQAMCNAVRPPDIASIQFTSPLWARHHTILFTSPRAAACVVVIVMVRGVRCWPFRYLLGACDVNTKDRQSASDGISFGPVYSELYKSHDRLPSYISIVVFPNMMSVNQDRMVLPYLLLPPLESTRSGDMAVPVQIILQCFILEPTHNGSLRSYSLYRYVVREDLRSQNYSGT